MAYRRGNDGKKSELDTILSEINNNISKDSHNKSDSGDDFNEVEQEDTTAVSATKPTASFHKTNDSDKESNLLSSMEENDESESESKTDTSPEISAIKRKGISPISQVRSHKRSTRHQKIAAVLGVVVTFFVIIGVVSSAWGVTQFASGIINSTSLKDELSHVIFPLVIIDTPEFESPSKLDNSAIVSSAIWKFIIDKTDKSKYQKDDLGSIFVPDVDIEYYIRQLYGTGVKIQHQSIDDASVQMVYSPESKYYVVESTPKFLPYTPRIDKITRNKDVYTLKVSYLLPDVMWNFQPDSKTQSVDKIMEYKLKKVDKSYQVMSVKLLEITTESTPTNTNGMSSEAPPPEDLDKPTDDTTTNDTQPQASKEEAKK